VPAVVLRFFSVYGPRQRPEMGLHLFIKWVLSGEPIQLTGDGLQVRGATYIGDCVEATVQTGLKAMPGETFNLGGGEIATVLDMIRKIEKISGREAKIVRKPDRKGDQLATAADIGKLWRHLGWKPTTGLDAGLAKQVEWQRALVESAAKNAK
jgi:nucleoside-diphosphate-sugar epimerase